MVKETEYYDLLCVEVTATDEQIKKAYRKQALKYHPDRPTGDTEKFKELSKAFQILSDSNTRYIYDTYGKEGNPPEKESVDATEFFDSIFGGGAFKNFLGDINFFGDMPDDLTMDGTVKTGDSTDVLHKNESSENGDEHNTVSTAGDMSHLSNQEIKKLKREQKEKLRQQMKEMQEKKDEATKKQIAEMTTYLNTLIDDYFLYQRQNRMEDYNKKIQKEADLLKVESFGLELVHLIGSIYTTKAESFMKANKTFGLSKVVTGFKDKKETTKSAYGILSSALELNKLANSSMGDLNSEEEISPEKQAEMEEKLMPKVLKTMWLMTKFESSRKVKKTCENVLKDSEKSKKERIERAKVMLSIGKIFKQTTRTKEEQEESQMFEDMIAKAKVK
ncbi:hypothetical protein FOG51_03131 [Hanseniaspora uvarum]|nr:hypothetical protein FOG51_03131 [Hanseniaspora uvarum]